MKKFTKIFLGFTATAMAVGLTVFVLNLSTENSSENPPPMPKTAEEVTEPAEPFTEPATYPVYEDYVPSASGMTEKAKALSRVNKDIVGWIKIDNTPVNYPVFVDPGAIPANHYIYGPDAHPENEYYLHHDINRNYLFEGVLFMDYRDRFGSVKEEQSENIVIYGHNMLNLSMFGSLRYYREVSGYYESHPFVHYESQYGTYDYVIFGYIITSGNWYTDFDYWNMEELDTKEKYNAYIDRIHRDQLIDTGIDVRQGDQLLTLSTCYRDEDNSRFIVVARRLRDGEKSGSLRNIQHTDAYVSSHPGYAGISESIRQKEKEEKEKEEKERQEKLRQAELAEENGEVSEEATDEFSEEDTEEVSEENIDE